MMLTQIRRPRRMAWWGWTSGLVVLLGIGIAVGTWDRSNLVRTPLDLAVPRPCYTFSVSNGLAATPYPFEMLVRVGNRVRVVQATTPAEFRLGHRRLVVQFRPLVRVGQLEITCRSSEFGGWLTGIWDANESRYETATFVSTLGRLGPRSMGRVGWIAPRWGARERYSYPWTSWPDFWRPPTPEELAALENPETWPREPNR